MIYLTISVLTSIALCFCLQTLKSDNEHLNNLLNNALNEVEALRSENAYLKEHIRQANKGVNYAR